MDAVDETPRCEIIIQTVTPVKGRGESEFKQF